ncbi:MAG: PAS domain-containing protein [Magnetococcales bacterium]|nr:PAS domain-containing protein [Magnetococcales bacterium]
MIFGIRIRYILPFLLLTVVAVAVVGFYLEETLGEWLNGHITAELRRFAQVGRTLIEAEAWPLDRENVDRLANRLGQDPAVRITFIAANGRVLGDSQEDGTALQGMGGYASMPEVQEAMEGSPGEETSEATVSTHSMLVIAVPFNHPQGGHGVVRAAISLADLSLLHTHLRGLLYGAGLLFLLFGLSLSNLSAQWVFRPLRYVVEQAHGMAKTVHAPRIDVRGDDAMAGLADSLNLLAAEKDQTLARLSAEQSRMATVLHSMGEGVIAVDEQHAITLMNRSAMELLRLSQPWDGKPLVTVLPAQVLEDLGLDLELADREPLDASTTEFELEGPTPRRLVAVMTPLHERQGHVVVLRDVTEKRRLDSIRRDFVANVSHELRTPVSVIQANAQTLLGNAMEDPAYRRVLATAMERNANRLARIIADLLDLSRLEADQFPMDMERLALLPLVQDVMDLIRASAVEKEISLHIDLPAGVSIWADAEAMRRILINFVDNAVKYIPPNSSIRVRLNGSVNCYRLEVLDDGPGIAPQHVDRLFERFYRVDSGRTRKMGGTGLGLSIVKHLAEKMGESVGMEAVLPHGTLFWVTVSQVEHFSVV